MNKYNPDGFHDWAPQRKIGGGWICFKKKPDQPQAPDPAVVAAAQTKSNLDTAKATATLNRTNQITPWGSQTYAPGTPDENGISQWTSTTTLAPAQQKLLDSSNHISQSMADLGQNQIGNVASTINKPLDFAGLPGLEQGALQGWVGGGAIQSGVAGVGGIQRGVDMRGVPSLVGGDALAGAMKDAQSAAYAKQKAYLDPQWAQDQHDLENKLTQQGVMQNSDAWNSATESQGRNKTFAYDQALQGSIGLGNAAQAQLYGQGLSSNQNAYGQALSNGNFANSAQAQQYGQNANDMAMANAAQAQKFGQGQQNANLNNQSQGQAFAQSGIARNQGLNELMTQQQNPLNVLNALRTGAQMTAPSFGATPQTNVAGTDIAGINQQNFANQMGAYNSQVQSNNGAMSGIFGLGGAALMSPLGTFNKLLGN
jgi:hypothetical protein